MMKNFTVIFAIGFVLLSLAACDAKKEKQIDNDTNVDIYEDFDFEDDNIEDIDTTASVEKETTEPEKKEPILKETEDGELSVVSEEELKKEEEKQKNEPKKEYVKKFYVIAGSFKNINNAVDLRAYLKTQGYPAMVLYPYQGYNRVAVKSFDTRAQAEAEIARVRAKNMSYKNEKLEYWLLWR